MKQIDRSPTLIKWIASLSKWLGKQRGLPIVIGIILISTFPVFLKLLKNQILHFYIFLHIYYNKHLYLF